MTPAMKRGSVTKAESELVSFWLPRAIAAMLDAAVRKTDTDRSKFIRSALREKLALKKLRSAEAAK